MPNHIRGIVLIEDSFGLDGIGHIVEKGDHMAVKGDHMGSPLPDGGRPALGDVVGWFKTMTTNAYIRGVKESGWEPFPGRLWQRNYYEHIIRNERGLERIRAYIDGNPARWTEDEENPDRISHR